VYRERPGDGLIPRSRSPVEYVYDKETEKAAKAQQNGCRGTNNNSIQFNSIYLCAKLNSPEANYKVSTGNKMKE
jgi:hypothetical protein